MTRPVFNRPVLYITLPSDAARGLQTTHAVFSMVMTDELTLKTPDALLYGFATTEVIKNCCPSLGDPDNIKTCDIPYILASIKIATSGSQLEFNATCPKCKNFEPYEISLQQLIPNLKAMLWASPIKLPNLEIWLQAPTYKEYSTYSLLDYQYTKQLYQLTHAPNAEDYTEFITGLFEKKKLLEVEYHASCIKNIRINDFITVDNSQHIEEWFNQCDVEIQTLIANTIRDANHECRLPEMEIVCTACQHNMKFPLELDFSNLFRNKLLSLTEEEIIQELNYLGESSKRLTNEILKMIWYMRGSISYTEAMQLTNFERQCIAKIIEENLEITKKSGLAFV